MIELTETQRLVGERWLGYRSDPVLFFKQMMGLPEEWVWGKMSEVLESLRDNQLTAVHACHSVSKTFLAGRAVVWFKSCFQPSTVVTTAPSDTLVRNQLWREIHAGYAAAGGEGVLGGNMTSLMWDLKPNNEILRSLASNEAELWEKNFAIGFSTTPDAAGEHATRMHGFHNKWVLVILDEACGLLPQIWRTVLDSLVINDRVKVLAIGNPTDPESYFAKVCEGGSGWNVINISVQDTPNFKEGREVVPSVAGREYEKRMREEYGEDSNTYRIRVLGQFPYFREGTYFGYEYALMQKKRQIGEYCHDPSAMVFGFWDLGDMHTVGLFVQFIRSRVRVIDCYYDNQGLGLPEYARVVRAKPYIWGGHWAGPDLESSNRLSVQTGRTTKSIARQLGMDMKAVPGHPFKDGIEAIRFLLPLMDINESNCDDFPKAIKVYGKRKNEVLSTPEKVVYHSEPRHDWSSHFMDACRHLAIQYRVGSIGGQCLGMTLPVSSVHRHDSDDKWDSRDYCKVAI